MKKYIYLIISLFAFSVLVQSCKKTDLTPAYIEVNPEDFENCIDVSRFNETHSQNFDQEQLAALTRHKFTHVNVYVDNKNLGCWELPCKVPVLDVSSADTSTLILIPAFPLTGMGNTIMGYPFLNICRQKVVLKKNASYAVAQNPPKFEYSEYTRFPYFETFSNSTSFTASYPNRSPLTLLPVAVEGKNVGEIVMSDSTYQNFDITSTPFAAPVGSYRVMLEVRYKSDCNVDISAKLSTGQNPNTAHSVGGFFASPNEWKTIHFDLTNTINGYHNAAGYVTELSLVLSGAGKKGTVSRVYIDDIKVVYIRTA